jgi:predicted transcriptional regulator
MSQEKREAIELIQRLPEDVTIQDIMEQLYFKQRVDKGLRDVAEGRVISHQELKERIARWRKSVGH